MDDIKEKKEPPEMHPPSPEHRLPMDTRLLSDAVIELNISRKNVGIYPPGHIQITRSIDRAYDILLKLFELRPEMTLGVAKDTLLVGQDYLDQKNPVYRDFALSLNQQGIAAVTFVQGLSKEELIAFHRILTTKPEDIRGAGGIRKVMSDAAIPHIRMHDIDYAGFQVTEEKEIFRPPSGKTEERSTAGMWQDFIAHLVSGTIASSGEGVSLTEAADINPAELARLLNERKLNAASAIESYDRIISTHVRQAAEKKQPTKEQSIILEKLNNLVKNLHPDLRRQFLSTAFQRLSSPNSAGAGSDVLGEFPDDMVIEMLNHANQEGREISPTLAGIVQKLSTIPGAGGRVHQQGTDPGIDQPMSAVSSAHMEKLFDRESYETFVTPDYDTTLKNLARNVSQPAAQAEAFLLEEHVQSLTDDHLDFQIGRALLAFIEEDIDEDDYREFNKKLVTIMTGLLETGNFMLLLDIFQTLRHHCAEKSRPAVRTEAEESLKIFKDRDFMAKAVMAFDKWSKSKSREAADLLLALGHETVPALLDIYAGDEVSGGRKVLFELLCKFGPVAANEALKRLGDPRPNYIRKLIMLIRTAGDHNSVAQLKPLLRHSDPKVRFEAMSALLRFKDPEAVSFLRNALHSKDPDVSSEAVSLAGQYRVGAVTGDLLSMIKKVILFESDYVVNGEIIKALGEIGDPRAVPEMEKIARASLSLYPQTLSRTKELLFESLNRYPKETIVGLLSIGERSGNEKIKRTCRKLSERK